MPLNYLHARLLSAACANILAKSGTGTVAYVRCLTPDLTDELITQNEFAPEEWQVWRVADVFDQSKRWITADHAVELREQKTGRILLLVNTMKAGAGMDGIYSAAREIKEYDLFVEANKQARKCIIDRSYRDFAERAIKLAKSRRLRTSLSPWTEFDFYIQCAYQEQHPATLLWLLGLWPVSTPLVNTPTESLDISLRFIERLLGHTSTSITPAGRIEALRLLPTTQEQRQELEEFVRIAAVLPSHEALRKLSSLPDIWINKINIEGPAVGITSTQLIPWRNSREKLHKWSGLQAPDEQLPDDPPIFYLIPDISYQNYSKLEVRWMVRPDNLLKGAADYLVSIKTAMDKDLVSKEVSHSGKNNYQKCIFTNDDLSDLDEDTILSAKIIISVIGNETISPLETEDFLIKYGTPSSQLKAGVGKEVDCFSEALIEILNERPEPDFLPKLEQDSKNYLFHRSNRSGGSYRVFRTPLLNTIEEQWFCAEGPVCRWKLRIRGSGLPAETPELVPIVPPSNEFLNLWDRVVKASRKLSEIVEPTFGFTGYVFHEKAKSFDIVKEYLNSWASLLDNTPSIFSLAYTIEIQNLSGRPLGLIVLPLHPLRLAWHAAYDNLLFHTRFDQHMSSQDILKKEVKPVLDGSMFPSFLPGLEKNTSFVFGDMLGFYAVAMVRDDDPEPRATIALFSTTLSDTTVTDISPTVGAQAAHVLGTEFIKYIRCHYPPPVSSGESLEHSHLNLHTIHIHALRAGDGLSIARALSEIHKRGLTVQGSDTENLFPIDEHCFSLNLFPSKACGSLSGRFLSQTIEKKRSGAGSIEKQDIWMIETITLDNGVTIPRLRWARKEDQIPTTSAHIAVSFDTFDARVSICESNKNIISRTPLHVFGLVSYFQKTYDRTTHPVWYAYPIMPSDGERHPSDRAHTDRLLRLQNALLLQVAKNLGTNNPLSVSLKTELSVDNENSLRILHILSDWVITIDRNAGIEYFDSPKQNIDTYDSYVIDCVPERDDLGTLQLVTSTNKLDEVRTLIDHALTQMGLSCSRRNAEFLLNQLKSLSGRLAIRLTGQTPVTGELIALALVQHLALNSDSNNDAWVSLKRGFFIPVDDVRDILPPPASSDEDSAYDLRPDIIHVSADNKSGLCFRFIEVKYRRHLSSARSADDINKIIRQTQQMRERWEDWYFCNNTPITVKAIRRSKLSRVLRFYAEKAGRHYLEPLVTEHILIEIDKLVANHAIQFSPKLIRSDRGYIFCPEYNDPTPLEVSPDDSQTRVFLFGPCTLPDISCGIPSYFPKLTTPLPSDNSNPNNNITNNNSIDTTNNNISDQKKVINDLNIPTLEKNKINILQLGIEKPSNTVSQIQISIKGNPHLMVVGLPGMGKTTCLVNICKQFSDLCINPIVFSYHQDIDARLVDSMGSENVHFLDYQGLSFNPLYVNDNNSSTAFLDVAGAVRDIFCAIFTDLGDLQAEQIRNAIKESYCELGWSLNNQSSNALPPFRRFYEILKSSTKPDQSLKALLARLSELDDYGFYNVNDNPQSLWPSSGALVLRLHRTQNEVLQRAFASLVFYSLYKDMFRRGPQEKLTHAIIFDEAHRASRLKLIPTMAKECRKYGISLVLASQEAKDFNTSLYSAIANYLVLRLNEIDAKVVVRNVSSSDQERLLVDRIKSLDRFYAYFFCEGNKKPSLLALNA